MVTITTPADLVERIRNERSGSFATVANNRLDLGVIAAVAIGAREELDAGKPAAVSFCPGDMTNYVVVVTPAEAIDTLHGNGTGGAFFVTHSYGPGYWWNGHAMFDPGYVQSKWFRDNEPHAAEVLALLLTAIALAE